MGRPWMKDTWNLSLLFLKTLCGSATTWEQLFVFQSLFHIVGITSIIKQLGPRMGLKKTQSQMGNYSILTLRMSLSVQSYHVKASHSWGRLYIQVKVWNQWLRTYWIHTQSPESCDKMPSLCPVFIKQAVTHKCIHVFKCNSSNRQYNITYKMPPAETSFFIIIIQISEKK